MGSYHMMSDEEKPSTTSMCVVFLVNWFTSWHRAWALVNNIFVRFSV